MRLWSVLPWGFAVGALFAPSLAQVATPQTPYPDNYPPALPERKGPEPPRLRFERHASVPLPGPIPGEAIHVEAGAIVVAVAGGFARVPQDATEGASPSIDAAPPEAPEPDPWALAPDDSLRFRLSDSRTIVAERASRLARDGWRHAWRIRSTSAILAAPVLVGPRLCYATLGDEVLCVRADNGHRLWATDLGSRLSRPLEVWKGTVPVWNRDTNRTRQDALEVLIAVPDRGDSIVAIDAWNGKLLATETLAPSEGWLVTGAKRVGDAIFAVARQGYVESDGALLLYRLESPEQRPGPDAGPDVSYNPSAPGR